MKTTFLSFVLISLLVLPLSADEPLVWSHSTSTTVRLGIREKSETLDRYKATFTVKMPDNGSASTTIEVSNGRYGYVTFPDDFEHVYAKDGHYTWSATLHGKKVVSGGFDFFTHQDGQRGVSIKFSDS